MEEFIVKIKQAGEVIVLTDEEDEVVMITDDRTEEVPVYAAAEDANKVLADPDFSGCKPYALELEEFVENFLPILANEEVGLSINFDGESGEKINNVHAIIKALAE